MYKLPKNEQTNVSLYSNALMLLTSVHHVYGAIRYHTPWRMHVLLLSVPVLIITIILDRVIKQKGMTVKSVWSWIYCSIIFLAAIVMIGSYEGLYNHLLKNILYFGGLSAAHMSMLFPPAMYEMPDDIFFEVTGVLQGIVVIPLGIYFVRMIRQGMMKLPA
ncbi:hypothetical protein QFZ51_002580 [Chitinophaga sp. W3I9]|uniref:hypothetical protein n=1 Tax=unclassified Chitinophaga TaxID=2619133 RepID=UPI003D1E8153